MDAFGTLNQVPPKRIFFFRDGLSEGEFAEVGANEIKAIEGTYFPHIQVDDPV